MEHAQGFLTDPNWGKSQEEKEYDFRKAFAEVKMFVEKALRDCLKRVQYRATKKEIEQLENMQSELGSIRFYDKVRLDVIRLQIYLSLVAVFQLP